MEIYSAIITANINLKVMQHIKYTLHNGGMKMH